MSSKKRNGGNGNGNDKTKSWRDEQRELAKRQKRLRKRIRLSNIER